MPHFSREFLEDEEGVDRLRRILGRKAEQPVRSSAGPKPFPPMPAPEPGDEWTGSVAARCRDPHRENMC